MNDTVEPSTPATFRDMKGREWEAVVNFVNLPIFKTACGVDLADISRLGQVWAQLLVDDHKTIDLVWVAIGGTIAPPNEPDFVPTATLAGEHVTKNEWLAAIDGNTVDAARRALETAIKNFTPPQKRTALSLGLAKVETAYRKAMREATTRMERTMTSATKRATKRVRRGTSARKSPASSDSSTTGGRSAKRSNR